MSTQRGEQRWHSMEETRAGHKFIKWSMFGMKEREKQNPTNLRQRYKILPKS